MKRFLIIAGLLIIAGYIVFAVFFLDKKPKDTVCSKFEIVLAKKTDNFIAVDEIKKMVVAKGLNPEGKKVKDINTLLIEQAIRTNQLVKSAEVYFTSSGNVRVILEARKPILRIISNTGENYYIDSEGNRMPLPKNFAANLPIATGDIKESFAKTDLYKFALFLYDNEFWNAQIEQIVVSSDQQISLVPRVGDQTIILGSIDGYEEKLGKLMTFYTNAIDKTGWNKYSTINLTYNKQVVCTKRLIK